MLLSVVGLMLTRTLFVSIMTLDTLLLLMTFSSEIGTVAIER
ncbi:hypothetical protein bcere0007_31560 [Bacillus mycoides]|uniref:Uncharacterized protein n=1 Tax=Bacillus mycoides TaxID=1405 RepID=C2PYL3_BACMY|nr:hypothetical protein bcere0007_31560 [Bacillus mycoides]EEL69931.1 hypothetical protein bcere0026_31320 [Bacillus mycoides]EEL98469.1 hypothetical protein bmyco0001_30910 [Bacillus mycoides DSM 2048]